MGIGKSFFLLLLIIVAPFLAPGKNQVYQMEKIS